MAYAIPKISTSGRATSPENPSEDRRGQKTAAEEVAWLQSTSPRSGPDRYRFVLLLRFSLLNLFGFSLLAAAYAQGLVTQALTADGTHISLVIFLAFLLGLVLCGSRIWQTSRELNSARRFDASPDSPTVRYLAPMIGSAAQSRGNLVGALRMKIAYRTAVVRHIASSLVLLGLIGTVVGFIIAMSGVDPQTASNVNNITPMVATLIQGMSTALYTTLIGSVLNVWLMANHQLLAGGTVKLITALVELAENHARN